MPIDQFTTERLLVRSWHPVLEDRSARLNLESALAAMLTRLVLEHLPPSLQLSESGGISSWIDGRASESDVLLVERKSDQEALGLLILAPASNDRQSLTVHIGYLLAEAAWGQGIASELVAGLADAVKGSGPLKLLAGVDKANPASARVLEKAGFSIAPDVTSEGSQMYVKVID